MAEFCNGHCYMNGELAGEALQFLVRRYKVNGVKLAELAGCSHSVIYRLRRSKALPSKPLANAIASALSILSGRETKAEELWAVDELRESRRNDTQRDL